MGLRVGNLGYEAASDGEATPAVPGHFRIDVHRGRFGVRVTPVGELDLATAPQLDDRLRELRESGASRLVLDLREVAFIDVAGLNLIWQWHSYAHETDITFTITEARPNIVRLLRLTGRDDGLLCRAA